MLVSERNKYPPIQLSLMGLSFVVPLVTKGYGLREEDLNEILVMERLNEISKRFSGVIQRIQEKFNSKAKIRIIEFNELSGSSRDSRFWFGGLIGGQRHLFYSHLHSNKDCCVIFYYAGFVVNSKLLNKRFLPHEFAHHYQLASQRVPAFLPKGTPKELVPQFANYCEIGPKEGAVYIDDALLDTRPIVTIKDFSERIADFVCERILLEKGFVGGILKEYRADRNTDPAKEFYTLSKAVIRYMRRLNLWDVAEWHATLHLIHPNDQALLKMLTFDKKWIIRLNKKHPRAKKAFDEIYETSLNTNYTSFKNVRTTVSYIKRVMELLGIEIRTKEDW